MERQTDVSRPTAITMRLAAFIGLCTIVFAAESGSGWWRGQAVHYRLIDGSLAVAEGDILLEPDFEASAGKNNRNDAVARNSSRYLWPDGVIPYVIDEALPNSQRVTDAVEHWNTNTPVRLIPRSGQSNYVRFTRRPDTCSSFIGMIGREQPIYLGDECSAGAVIHEIGHAAGLFHEQARNDRDAYIHFLTDNVDKRELSNFSQALGAGFDVGPYDFASIMHYDVTAFSRNGRPVLQTVPTGIPINQRERLSPGDVDAVRRLYNAPTAETTITTYPFGMDLEVDGERVRSPHTVRWTPGTRHAISAPPVQTSGNYRHLFARWSDEGQTAHSVIASADTTVYTASYVRQYKLPLSVVPASGGTLEIKPAPDDGWLTEGEEVEIRGIPSSGYTFAGWSGFGPFGLHGVSPNPLRVLVRGPDLRYIANFTAAPLTLITSNPPGLRVVVDGETVTTPRGYTWAPGSTHTLEVRDSPQAPGTGVARHHWMGWSNQGERTQTITAGSTSSSFVAQFRTQYQATVTASSGGTVSVTPASDGGYYDAGTTLTLQPTASPGFRFAGWTGDVNGTDAPAFIVVQDQIAVSALFGAPGQVLAGGVVNGASFLPGSGISPGTVVTVFGIDLGPDQLETLRLAGGRVDAQLAGVRVYFDEFPAPVLYVARNQLGVVVPFGVAGREEVRVRVTGPNVASASRTVALSPASPALFTADSSGRGQAAALNQDGSVNSASSPAASGSVVVLYATGLGEPVSNAVDGVIATGPSLAPKLPVSVRIAGRDAATLYAGAAPGIVLGVNQINVRVPDECPRGAVPVSVRAGGNNSSSYVTIYCQ